MTGISLLTLPESNNGGENFLTLLSDNNSCGGSGDTPLTVTPGSDKPLQTSSRQSPWDMGSLIMNDLLNLRTSQRRNLLDSDGEAVSQAS